MPIDFILIAIIVAAGFYMAWSIGANDVANAMGTSVGSGALTLRQAVVVAAILEFSGAFFFGSHVSETVQKGIIDLDAFSSDPTVLAYGMLASLFAAGLWLQVASYYGWPVSTTHTIIGAIVGFGAIYGGVDSVKWQEVFFIMLSWVISPISGGILSFLIFTFLKNSIFYAQDPAEACKRITPLIVCMVVTILTQVFILNGLHSLNLNVSFWEALLYSLIVGSLGGCISWILMKKMFTPSDHHSSKIAEGHSVVECVFGYLQIMSACLMAFAHGANDVANAIGPLAAAIAIVQTGTIAINATIPTWVLFLGGIGIVFGLATWGWRVIETIGKKITELTPTRGFAAEFGAATTIVMASALGMPVSTTHTLVGSVIGVGLARGMGALNLGMTRDIFISWVVTVPTGAIGTIIFFYIIKAIFR